MKKILCVLAASAFLASSPAPTFAQANKIPGTDVALGPLTVGADVTYWGRTGSFPNGQAGFSISTTSCNFGSVDVPWLQAMNENHPLIAFIFARQVGDRFEQISDRSYVKHGFFALSSSQCTPCQNPSNGTFLGVGCSDTYGTNNNGDRFWLGPADEINPWLGTWKAACSFFDAPTGGSCDGNRSYFGAAANSVEHRVTIADGDMTDATASYYYYGYYVILGEPESDRDNNGASREFIPSWNGATWSIATGGFPNAEVQGTILNRWVGATLTSVGNGGSDGRIHLGVKSSDLGGGVHHYEYAMHNRDNHRGIGSFTIPKSRDVVITNVGFSDVDGNSANNWTATVDDCSITFSTTSNPLDWNTVFNFWFDADMAPNGGNALTLGEFDGGGGLDFLIASLDAPVAPAPLEYCVGKLNSSGCVPFVSATGTASATGAGAFTITALDVVSNQGGLMIYSIAGRSNLNFHNGKLCVKSPRIRLFPIKNSGSGGGGSCTGVFNTNFNNRIQSGADPLLIPGICVNAQWIYRDPFLGDGFTTGLTNAVEFTIKN